MGGSFSIAREEIRVHGWFRSILILHATGAIALAFWHGTFLEAALIGLPAAFVPIWLARRDPHSRAARLAVGASLMIFSGLFIHQARGMTEVHFHVFVMLAMLLAFRDWRPIVTAAATIAVHHVSFAGLQALNAPVFIYTTSLNSLLLTVIHALFVVAETAMLCWLATAMRQDWQRAEQLSLVSAALATGGSTAKLDIRHVMGELESQIGISAKGLIRISEALESVESGAIRQQAESEQVLNRTDQVQQTVRSIVHQVARQKQEADLMIESIRELGHESEKVALSASGFSAATQQSLASSERLILTGGVVADAVQKAKSHAEESVLVSQEGGAAMQTALGAVVERVDQLVARSNDIQGIVSAIQSIADQTNMLALNAAIEAARAGESGRGFAVVADEVRVLADRSRQAAKAVGDLVAGMTSDLEATLAATQGNSASRGLAGEANEALRRMESSIHAMSQVLDQVAAAAQEVKSEGEASESMAREIASLAAETASATQYTSSLCTALNQGVQSVQSGFDESCSLAQATLSEVEQVSDAFHRMSAVAVDTVKSVQSLESLTSDQRDFIAGLSTKISEAAAVPEAA